MDDDIFELEWTVRAQRIFRREGIRTTGDLVALSRADLRRFKNLGRATLLEIELQLVELGLGMPA